MLGKEQHLRRKWEYFLRERDAVIKFREPAEEEKQAGIQGQWQLESPEEKYFKQVKRHDDTCCTEK